MAESAQIIDPGGRAAAGWRVGLLILIGVTFVHIVATCARGGKLRYFLWPFNVFWLVGRLRRGGYYAEARDAVWDMPVSLRLPYYFLTIREHEPANFRYSASCYGVSRSEDVVYIQITVFDTRTAQQKKALFRRTAELLGESPGIRPENVFVNVLESAKENWSVGHGLAQFA